MCVCNGCVCVCVCVCMHVKEREGAGSRGCAVNACMYAHVGTHTLNHPLATPPTGTRPCLSPSCTSYTSPRSSSSTGACCRCSYCCCCCCCCWLSSGRIKPRPRHHHARCPPSLPKPKTRTTPPFIQINNQHPLPLPNGPRGHVFVRAGPHRRVLWPPRHLRHDRKVRRSCRESPRMD
jgi:hypothetical protein